MCCRLNILGWRLQLAFNAHINYRYIRACIRQIVCLAFNVRYISARIRQIVWCVHPWMLHSFWMNFLMKLILIVHTLLIYTYCFVSTNHWIHCPTEKLLMCVQCLMPFHLAWCGECIWCREWILQWRLNLHQPFWVCPVSWLQGKKIFLSVKISLDLFVNVQCFMICEPKNWHHSWGKLLSLLY